MSTHSRSKALLLLAVLLLILGMGAVSIGFHSLSGNIQKSIEWRSQLFTDKALGKVPEFTWPELWRMSRQHGGFGLETFVTGQRSLAGSVTNPFITERDIGAGGKIFGTQCAPCHGPDGSGLQGPALNRPGFRHGDSDMAIYRVIRDGVPETAMASQDLTWRELWQVTGYIRRLQANAISNNFANGEAQKKIDIHVSGTQLRTAADSPNEWITYSGTLSGQRYSSLNSLTQKNASQLKLRWVRQLGNAGGTVEATPLVADGIIFLTLPPAEVIALDAKSGQVVWRYQKLVNSDLPLCCGRVNRGLAILDNHLFFATLDGHLIAIDANTGHEIWDINVAKSSSGYTMTGAPLIVGQRVVVGVAGGEYGIRGYLAAYDAVSGSELWKFNTIPGPGEAGHETWQGDSWRTGGGPTWATGSYDADLDLIYWGVGNPAPVYDGDVRPGDNLYTNSVLALRASTGKLAWYFQFTPHDVGDYDAAQTPILADLVIDGRLRKVMCWPNRNGFYYVLDRTNGEFLLGVPFAEVNWTTGLDPRGRPKPGSNLLESVSGRVTKPSNAGATNWQNSAFDPERSLIFVPAVDAGSVNTVTKDVPHIAERDLYLGSSGSVIQPITLAVQALDAATGKKKWTQIAPKSREFELAYSGLLATRGGIVIGAMKGDIFALDSDTGNEVWRVPLGGVTKAPPITFTIDGQQVIGIAAGSAFFVFGL